jgi:HAE1 family hydrophobic/amphiphilic exporter-1
MNLQGAGVVTTVFNMDYDVRFAEQKIIQSLARVRADFPTGILEPTIRTIDPSDVPLMTFALVAELPEGKLFDLAEREIKPRFEQVSQVALIEIKGGRKREIQVEIDRNQLATFQMSLGEVAQRLGMSGINIPVGQIDDPKRDTLVRSVGQFYSLGDIERIPIRFVGNEKLITLGEIADIRDGLADEQNRVYIAGKRALTFRVFRQSGGDTIRIARDLEKQASVINTEFKKKIRNFNLELVHDGTKPIHDGVREATFSIQIGVILTILVVFFFLGNIRSTLITGIALPNSLFGAFLLMWIAGFSINITTLAALSLAVGLLIDDAIVVRESIFRRIEKGEAPLTAAVNGTNEVALAVIATTFTVLSVFGPIAFLQGIIGQFFKEFGLTICFAMLISLLDSLTMAPMLSAYFPGGLSKTKKQHGINRYLNQMLNKFSKFQASQEHVYLKLLKAALKHPILVLSSATLIFVMSLFALNSIPKSFVPPAGAGEFRVTLNAPPGTSFQAMDQHSSQIDQKIRSYPEVSRTVLNVGGENGESHQANIIVLLKDAQYRNFTTNEMKERVRQDLGAFPAVTGAVQDMIDIGGGAGQPYVVNITGENLNELKIVSKRLVEHLKKGGDLKDIDTSYRPGASELQFVIDPLRAREFGISSSEVGQELRLLLAGASPAKYHENGEQYNVHLRLKSDQRDLKKDFKKILVPNLNHRLIPLSSIARQIQSESPSTIQRENRKRYIEVSADVDTKGRGLAHALQITQNLFESQQIKLPPGVDYAFSGQTKDFQDLLTKVILAIGLSIGFMYLVLASLYESFFTPFTIMLVLPLAICGAFYGLFFTHSPLEINSMIGCILLLGVAAKNSILLVDHIQEGLRSGQCLRTAIFDAGKVRLRPIMMTSFALIAGMLPVAIPLEEAAKQRSGMAIAVIGGIITSTLLTLVVVPTAYGYIQSLQDWTLRKLRFSGKSDPLK